MSKKKQKSPQSLEDYVKPGLPLQSVKKLKSCFDIFDADSSGSLSIKEFQQTCMGLQMSDSIKSVVKLAKSFAEANQTNEVDFQSFLEMFGFSKQIDQQSAIQSVFKQYDTAGKGYFDEEDIRSVSIRLGERYTDREIHDMFRHADKDKDGKICLEEFRKIVGENF